jgi:alkanesulfonate monooxygenase SsuD/methylene tetrahydromethanopterin reductase-like flavin-dependent oxidoreductase (luciferase family)
MGDVAERLGSAFVWVPDHLLVVRGPDEAPTFEAFTLLAAIAGRTERVRLGPGVACAGFRNPALLVKMATLLDVASGAASTSPSALAGTRGSGVVTANGFPLTRVRLA